MHLRPVLPLVLALLTVALPLSAADKIEDFLGLKFGASRVDASAAMQARGSKLIEDKAGDAQKYKGGTYGGETITDLTLQFVGEKFTRATVAFETHSGKREEAARLGVECYDRVRKALTEKYGPPSTTTSVPRAQLLAGKETRTETLKSQWQSAGAFGKEKRTITLQTVTIALYSWVFNVTYEETGGPAAPGGPRKDL